MRLNFWRRERKSSATNRAIVLGLNLPGPVAHEPYKVFADEGYLRNVDVHDCVTLISRTAAPTPWILYERGRGPASNPGKARRIVTKASAEAAWNDAGPRRAILRKSVELSEIEDHDLLRLIERPNPLQGQADFLEQDLSYFLLSGNSYEEFVAIDGDRVPREVFSLRPDRMEIVPASKAQVFAAKSALGTIVGAYLYSVRDRKNAVSFAPESILHRKMFHPTHDWYGLSPLQVALRTVRTDNLAEDWNYALIKNEAKPSGALVVPTTLPDHEYDRVKLEIVTSLHGNPGEPLLLTGGLKWERMGLTPSEMDWLNARKFSRVKIASIYHVPPEMLGDAEHKTYNSFPEARASFWHEALIPLLEKWRDGWNNALAPRWGDRLYLDFDRDQIDAIQEDQDKLVARIGKSTWLSVNEQRVAAGYDVIDDSEADVPVALRAGFGVQPGGPFVNNEPKEKSNGDPIETKGPLSVMNGHEKNADGETKEQRLTARQTRALRKFERTVSAAFDAQGRALWRKVSKELGS